MTRSLKWLLLISGLCLMTPVQAVSGAARFYVETSRNELVLGQALTLSVHAENMSAPLDQFKYDVLQRDFDIQEVSVSHQSTKRGRIEVNSEVMELTLYSLHAGRIVIPALEFATRRSSPALIEVLESGPDVPRVLFKSGIAPHNPVQRQEVYFYLDIHDDGALQWRAPKSISAEGCNIRALPESQREETSDGVHHVVHRYAWGVMPLRAGLLHLIFPIVEAGKFGERLRYAVSPQDLSVAEAPSYLPVFLQVGRIKLNAEPLPEALIVGRPVNRNISITGSGLSREGIAKSLTGIAESAALHVYPAQYELKNSGSQLLEQELIVTIPMQPLKAGQLSLPPLRIPYYDPDSGLIQMAELPARSVKVIDPAAEKIRLGIMALAATGAMIWLGLRLAAVYRKYRARRKWLGKIADATDPQQLRMALLSHGVSGGNAAPETLQRWLAAHEDNSVLQNLVERLEQACYGTPPEDFAALRRDWVAAMKRSTLFN